jgi:acetyltransferase EpsM
VHTLQVVIIGAGGHGKELCSYIRDLSCQDDHVHLMGFLDEHKQCGPWADAQILGNFDTFAAFLRRPTDSPIQGIHYIVGVGDNLARQQLVQKAECLGLRAWTLRHPSAIVGRDSAVGAGSCLAPGSIVTANVRIGKHCIVNANACVHHDCVIEDLVNLNPGVTLAGNVHVGRGSFIGAGATVIENLVIGEGSIVGAGAVVIKDLPAHVTAVGVPARIVKRHPVTAQ